MTRLADELNQAQRTIIQFAYAGWRAARNLRDLYSSFLPWGSPHHHSGDPIEHQDKGHGGNRKSDAMFHQKPRGLRAIPDAQLPLGTKPYRTRKLHGREERPE